MQLADVALPVPLPKAYSYAVPEGLAAKVAPAPVVRVPFLATDVHDLDGLTTVGSHLF